MTVKNVSNLAASVHARLQNHAREAGVRGATESCGSIRARSQTICDTVVVELLILLGKPHDTGARVGRQRGPSVG